MLTALAVIGALLAGTLSFTIARKVTQDHRTQVELVAANETGSHPFTDSITDLSADDVATVAEGRIDLASADAATSDPSASDDGSFEVDAASTTLYASSSTTSICDTAFLIEMLDDDADARTAWLGLMDLDDDEMEAFIAELTPLVLTHDTAVSNSRYADGEGSWFQAVLQAGTAVLVDADGTPRIKCSCGNPLAPPMLDTATSANYVGDRWDRFDPDQVVNITPVEEPITTIRTIDLATGELAEVAIGSAQTIALPIYDVEPSPDCSIRYLDFYVPEDDNLAGVVPWDEVPGSAIFHRSTSPNVQVQLRNPSGELEEASLQDLADVLSGLDYEGDGRRFALCGPNSAVERILQSPATHDITEDMLVTIDGIGPASPGLTIGEVEVGVGHPLQVGFQNDEFDGACQQLYFYSNQDLAFLATDDIISRVEVVDGDYRTDRGIGIGSTEADVAAAYEGELTSEPHPYTDGLYLVYRPVDRNDRMMIFETEDGRVTSFRVGDTQTTPWIEGCA